MDLALQGPNKIIIIFVDIAKESDYTLLNGLNAVKRRSMY